MPDTRIMIVEDEILVARDIKSRLARMGLDVVAICNTPQSAIDTALAKRPHLILMDINLGADMDGIDAAKAIREYQDIPIIYCTAYSNKEVLERAKQTAPLGYVLKPFDNRELEISIDFALSKHAMEMELRRSSARLDATLQSIFDGVVAYHSDGTIFLFNASAERITGLERREVIGRPITEVLQLESRDTGVKKIGLDWWLSDSRDQHTSNLLLSSGKGLRIPVEIDIAPILTDDQGTSGSVVVAFRDISRRLDYEQQIQRNAFYEPLTGLPNATVFRDRLDMALKLSRRRENHHFAVLFVDLDRFRVVNEGLGHEIGDKVLCEVAKRISSQLRDVDTLTRFSADMFVCLLEPVESPGAVIQLVARFQLAVSRPFYIQGHPIKLTASVGIAMNDRDYRESQDILRDADTAMFRAKQRGRGSHMLFDDDMHQAAVQFIDCEEGLQQALDREEIEVYYQPIVEADSYRVVAMEGLVRWRRGERGMIPPALFVPVAEDTGLIVELGEAVLRQICRQMRLWADAGLETIKVSVNLSVRQFEDPFLLKRIVDALSEFDIPAEWLNIEITESTAMRDVDHSLSVLASLRDAGLTIAVDDFGTGYSSLAYLKRMPIHTLKIDRCFVTDVVNNYDDQAIVKAIVAMANELQMTTLVEGVESEEQAELLRYLGCEKLQGYLFGRPVRAEEVPELLNRSPNDKAAATGSG